MKEIWKDISGYEGIYQASNLGNIKSICRKFKDASMKTGIKYQNISSCCRKQQKTAGGYTWEYC